MRLMVITVDGEVMQSNVVVDKARLGGVLARLASLWWVREVYPVA